MVRSFIAPENNAPTFSFASAGGIQLLFGPASLFDSYRRRLDVLCARHHWGRYGGGNNLDTLSGSVPSRFRSQASPY